MLTINERNPAFATSSAVFCSTLGVPKQVHLGARGWNPYSAQHAMLGPG